MSNSNLVAYTKLSPNRTSPRKQQIDTITIHCMAGNLTIETCGDVFAPIERSASSNYGVGSDGRIGMYVEECNRSWCSSSPSNDHRSVTIEVANDGDISTGWHVSDKALSSLIKLCADICIRNGIPKLLWKGDKSLIGQVDQQNMTSHRWFANTDCPGNYLFSKYGYIADEVNKIINGESEELTMSQYEDLNERLKKLEEVMVYGWVDNNMPDWARSTITKLCDRGVLKGTGDEKGLNLTESDLRHYVVLDRAGIFDDTNELKNMLEVINMRITSIENSVKHI